MYAYRNMSREQQHAVVLDRTERHRPWHRPYHLKDVSGWYLITGATYEHRPHFSAPNELKALELRLFEELDQSNTRCAAWVAMPNHYHLLAEVRTMPSLGRSLGRVHGRSSRYANLRDETPGRQVWYKYSDRKVRTERHFWTCVHYIMMNPVKHGYVDRPEDWPWSTKSFVNRASNGLNNCSAIIHCSSLAAAGMTQRPLTVRSNLLQQVRVGSNLLQQVREPRRGSLPGT